MGSHKHIGEMPKTRIGKRVHFGPPGDVRKAGGHGADGTVMDEVWTLGEEETAEAPTTRPRLSWGRYCFFSQLIRWDSGRHTVRLGYYRRRAGENHWEFGSQTTVNAAPATVRALLTQTIARTKWWVKS